MVLVERYTPSQTIKVKEQFRKHFGLRFNDYYDPIVTIAAGYLHIDIEKFNNWLFQTNPGNDHLTFNQLLIELHGLKAKEFIDQIT